MGQWTAWGGISQVRQGGMGSRGYAGRPQRSLPTCTCFPGTRAASPRAPLGQRAREKLPWCQGACHTLGGRCRLGGTPASVIARRSAR